MPLLGTPGLLGTSDAAEFLEALDNHVPWHAIREGHEIVLTRSRSPEFHQPMALFTSRGFRRLLEDAGCEVLTLAAANPISRLGQPFEQIAASAEAEWQLAPLETAICEEPGKWMRASTSSRSPGSGAEADRGLPADASPSSQAQGTDGPGYDCAR